MAQLTSLIRQNVFSPALTSRHLPSTMGSSETPTLSTSRTVPQKGPGEKWCAARTKSEKSVEVIFNTLLTIFDVFLAKTVENVKIICLDTF